MSLADAHGRPMHPSCLDGDSPLTFSRYQQITAATDQFAVKGVEGLQIVCLGLFGETGSLLSGLKKKKRDQAACIEFRDSVMEELGDVLWYLSNAAHRAGIQLSVIAEKSTTGLSHCEYAGNSNPKTFADLQKLNHGFTGLHPANNLQEALFVLADHVGRITASVNRATVIATDVLKDQLSQAFAAMITIADRADISLNEVTHKNTQKILSRWPVQKEWGPHFDDEFDPDERLPRKIEMAFQEKSIGDKQYVIQKCNGINIGDRLTDNRVEQDDYRFHDVFHLAYAAILGWSPVMRALFKVKRKSCPKIDENEDGARAILIEEGISTWCFNHGTRNRLFDGIDSLDYSLLKAVRGLVLGFEVQERPLWQWETAILEGFRVFRELQKHRNGIVIADLEAHTIEFKSQRCD